MALVQIWSDHLNSFTAYKSIIKKHPYTIDENLLMFVIFGLNMVTKYFANNLFYFT